MSTDTLFKSIIEMKLIDYLTWEIGKIFFFFHSFNSASDWSLEHVELLLYPSAPLLSC